MTRQYSYWTQKDILLLKQMINAGLTVKEMANRFMCTDDRIRDRMKQDTQRFKDRKKNAARVKAWRDQQKAAGKAPKWACGGEGNRRGSVHSSSRPTPEMIEEAQQRYLAPRSLTSSFFGDPPKGWSALDRRQGA